MDRQKKVKVTDDGYFVFGIGRDRKYDVVITQEFDGKKQRIIKKLKKEIIKYRELTDYLKKKLLLQKKYMKELKEKIK